MKGKNFSLRIVIVWIILFLLLEPLLTSIYFGFDFEFFFTYLLNHIIGLFNIKNLLSVISIYSIFINLIISYFFARSLIYLYDKPTLKKHIYKIIKYWYITLAILVLIILFSIMGPHLYNLELAKTEGSTKYCRDVWGGLNCYASVAYKHKNIHFCEPIDDEQEKKKCVTKVIKKIKDYMGNRNDYCNSSRKLGICIRNVSLIIKNDKPILLLGLDSEYHFSSRFLESTLCKGPLDESTNLPQFPAQCIMRNDLPHSIVRNDTYHMDYSTSKELTDYVKNGGYITIAYVRVNSVPLKYTNFIGLIGLEFNNETIEIIP